MIIVKSRRIRVLLSQSPDGAVNSGTQAIVQRYEGIFKLGANNISITRSQLTQLGNDVAIALGEYQVTGQGQSGPIKIDGDWSATLCMCVTPARGRSDF